MKRKPETESIETLRQRYHAQTDIEIDPEPEDWKQYAGWLERLTVKDVNDELVLENEILLNAMREAIGILERGLAASHTRIAEKIGAAASKGGPSRKAGRWLYPLLISSKKAGGKKKGGKSK